MKILIADDELPIREWLTYSMKAVAPQAEILKSASDGREALQLVRAEHPDIVFVDIKMPVMDGLELLRHIKELDASTYVVMLTSYEDFDYAREALQEKANEYVLKSEITQDGLKQILLSYERICEAQDVTISPVYLQKVFAGTALWETLSLPEKGNVFAVAYAALDTRTECRSFETYYNNFVQEIFPCPYNETVMVLLCCCTNNVSTGKSFQETMTFCRNIVSLRQTPVGFSGVGKESLMVCRKALKALCGAFYSELPTVLTYSEPSPALQIRQEEIRKKTVSALYKGQRDEAAQMVAEILQEAAQTRNQELTVLRNTMTDIISAYKLSLIEFSNTQMEQLCQKTRENIRVCTCFSQMKQEMEDFLTQCCASVYVKGAVRSNHVKAALTYMIEHYATITTIGEIATHVNLNTEYLCRLFKAETGDTINQYLTDLRIKKAIELLNHTEMRVYEVAQAVGYSNLSYFSRVFKKSTGENPFAHKK